MAGYEGASRAALIPESHNYPGFKGIPGPALLARLREQASLYGAPLERGRVSVCTIVRKSALLPAGVGGNPGSDRIGRNRTCRRDAKHRGNEPGGGP